ncbi:hypothetical protein ACEWY4_000001 [Coilia grayii]|uniref:Leucine-rich repeats and calponin homology (CH) domain containing 1 n=1 Tax=Coilia grayii TaxID=363190 RepID=A0ABD1KVD7_9TELE
MATLAPEPCPHPQHPSAAVGSSLGGVGSGTSLSLNRGLERALEEAASSGRLNLSSRKLKEFPKSAANYDLTDTVEADLSRNRLADVPSEVCHLVALESLNLYHNCIKSVPDTLISLHTLTSLNLSRNQLCVLPACVCGLPLRVLNVSNNKLNTLPDGLSQIHTLMELDVSCNELTSLPRHVGRLRALRELNVRRNLLCVLPDDLANVPLVCMRGMVHIFKYLALEACRGEKIDVLYLPINHKLRPSRPGTGSVEDVARKHDSDSGLGSDNGDKRLSATEPSDEDMDPAGSLQLSYQDQPLSSPFLSYIQVTHTHTSLSVYSQS